jgi:hypothetical protein
MDFGQPVGGIHLEASNPPPGARAKTQLGSQFPLGPLRLLGQRFRTLHGRSQFGCQGIAGGLLPGEPGLPLDGVGQNCRNPDF